MTKNNQHPGPQRNLQVRKIILGIMPLMVVVFTFILFSPTGKAGVDKLSDFKEAVSKEGCEAIPYSSERNTCKDRSRDKDQKCRDFSCDRGQVEKDRETYREKYKNLQDARARNDEQAVRSLEEKVKELDEKLKAHVAEAKQRIDNGYDCLAAREYVQRSFSDARQMVQAESDPDLQPFIPDLVRKYEEGQKSHISPMQEVTTSISNCQWVKELSW